MVIIGVIIGLSILILLIIAIQNIAKTRDQSRISEKAVIEKKPSRKDAEEFLEIVELLDEIYS